MSEQVIDRGREKDRARENEKRKRIREIERKREKKKECSVWLGGVDCREFNQPAHWRSVHSPARDPRPTDSAF